LKLEIFNFFQIFFFFNFIQEQRTFCTTTTPMDKKANIETFHKEDGVKVRNFKEQYTFDSPQHGHKRSSAVQKKHDDKPIVMTPEMAELMGVPTTSQNPHMKVMSKE
tara:strand:- start:178 stop:498 length:321 start_codon:yes stop_codon:yes gene_type:complete